MRPSFLAYLLAPGIAILSMAFLVNAAIDGAGLFDLFHPSPGMTYGADCWYDARFIHAPVTHLALWGHPTKVYWKNNAIGSQRWLVSETTLGDKTFWTVLKRIDLSTGTEVKG